MLGIPGAPLLGLQAGVANFVPYLGPLIAALPVALAAIKYADLSNGLNKDYVFDVNRMVQTTGNTGPYLQYAHARIAGRAYGWMPIITLVLYVVFAVIAQVRLDVLHRL